MDTVNYILLVIGAVIILLGAIAFFNPNLTRIINAPGGPKLKSIIAIIIGIIIVAFGLINNY